MHSLSEINVTHVPAPNLLFLDHANRKEERGGRRIRVFEIQSALKIEKLTNSLTNSLNNKGNMLVATLVGLVLSGISLRFALGVIAVGMRGNRTITSAAEIEDFRRLMTLFLGNLSNCNRTLKDKIFDHSVPNASISGLRAEALDGTVIASPGMNLPQGLTLAELALTGFKKVESLGTTDRYLAKVVAVGGQRERFERSRSITIGIEAIKTSASNSTITGCFDVNSLDDPGSGDGGEDAFGELFAVSVVDSGSYSRMTHSFCSSGADGVDCTVPAGKILRISEVADQYSNIGCGLALQNQVDGQNVLFYTHDKEFNNPFNFAPGAKIRFQAVTTYTVINEKSSSGSPAACDFTGLLIDERDFKGRSGEFFGVGMSSDSGEFFGPRFSHSFCKEKTFIMMSYSFQTLECEVPAGQILTLLHLARKDPGNVNDPVWGAPVECLIGTSKEQTDWSAAQLEMYSIKRIAKPMLLRAGAKFRIISKFGTCSFTGILSNG